MIESITSVKFGTVSKAKNKNNSVSNGAHSVNQNSTNLHSDTLNAMALMGKANAVSFKGMWAPDVKETDEIREIKTQLKKDIDDTLHYGVKMAKDADKEIKTYFPSLREDVLPVIEAAEAGEPNTSFSKEDKPRISSDFKTAKKFDEMTGNCVKEIYYTGEGQNISIHGYNEYTPDGKPVILTADYYGDGKTEELKYNWPMQEEDDRLMGCTLVKFNKDCETIFYTQPGPFLSGLHAAVVDPKTGKETLRVSYHDAYDLKTPREIQRLPQNPKHNRINSIVNLSEKGKPYLMINNEKDDYIEYSDGIGYITIFARGDKSFVYNKETNQYEYREGDMHRVDISDIPVPHFNRYYSV